MTMMARYRMLLAGATVAAALTNGSVANAYTTCPNEVASSGSTYSTSMTFYNESSQTVMLYWLNFQGQRVQYATLQPHQNHYQQTYYQHIWAATDSWGNCIDTFVAGSSHTNVTIY